jgi:nucleotide-binding universal stress UspA family protein
LKAPSEGLENIMYATAFQAIDDDVIHFLSDKAMNAKKLVLLHVGERAPDPRAEERRRRQVQDNLDRLAGECSLQYGRIETISVLGKPSRQIVRQARSREIDLIVIGKLDNPDSFGSMMGSTAEQLVHRSPCSLLVIPRGAAEGRLQDSRERD